MKYPGFIVKGIESVMVCNAGMNGMRFILKGIESRFWLSSSCRYHYLCFILKGIERLKTWIIIITQKKFHPQRNWKICCPFSYFNKHISFILKGIERWNRKLNIWFVLKFHPQRNWKSLTPTVSDWIIWVSSSKELKEVCSHFRVPNAYQCFILKGIESLCHASCLSERVCSCFILKGIESIDWLPPRPGTVDPKSYYEK